MTGYRPEWAHQAYTKWHKAVCDHARPETCGFEGALWFRSGDGWSRKSDHGRVVTFFEDGRIDVR